MTPTEHVVSEGVLSDIPAGKLAAGATMVINTGVTFLAPGSFEINATVNATDRPSSERIAGRYSLVLVVQDQETASQQK